MEAQFLILSFLVSLSDWQYVACPDPSALLYAHITSMIGLAHTCDPKSQLGINAWTESKWCLANKSLAYLSEATS